MKSLDKKSSSEGDVETSIIIPLLTSREHFSIPHTNLKSKKYISPAIIDKGNKRKKYVPDYLIYIESIPVAVIEAKSPSEDALIGYQEASLYALEINRNYASDINPCRFILSTNGIDIKFGFWDSTPNTEFTVDDLMSHIEKYEYLKDHLKFESLSEYAKSISTRIRINSFKRPFNQGEGVAMISSKLEPNTFSADLSPVLRRYFTSHDQYNDPEIYNRAYISSNELTGYDRELESFLKDRIRRSGSRIPLKPERHSEPHLAKVLTEHSKERPISGALQLVTGGVGAGKSLFARRYRAYLQPEEIREKNHWAFIDFNEAPKNLENAEFWVCEQFARSIVEEGAPIDSLDPDDQERLFAPKLNERKSYYDRMNSIETSRGDLERARDIEQWRTDSAILTTGISRYLQGDKGENIVVVFDNVDRRETDDQLQAFQLALWFMGITRALVILQMRDITFETFKNEPPLDTYRSGPIFHISPPRFIDVVRRRLELSLEALAEHAPEKVSYTLPSGTQITYPKTRSGEYLRTIYNEIFQNPRNISRVIEALSGRDVRRALGMFMAIITSGHMPDDLITGAIHGDFRKNIPEYRIIRILMREDYRFYNSNSGFISNIFYCESNWERPSNFLVPEILFWLIGKRKVTGDNGQMGYFSVSRICDEMEVLGFVRSDIKQACEYVLKNRLVEADTLSAESLDENDCIKATASAWAHMRILSERVEYIHSILPSTPIYDEELRAVVFDRMRLENRFGSLTLSQARGLAERFLTYLVQQNSNLQANFEYNSREQTGAAYIIGKVRAAVERSRVSSDKPQTQLDWLDQ